MVTATSTVSNTSRTDTSDRMASCRFRRAVPLLIALALTLPLQAQKSQMEKVQSFTENGIRVILSPADNQLVSVIVGLEGGVASGETTNPVLGEFTSDLITSSGSTRYPKEALRQFASRTSTSITGDGDYRGISFNMTATRPNFDKAWDVLASLIREPLFDETEYRNILQSRVAQVERRYSNPDNQAYLIADSLIKLGNPVLSRWTRKEDVEAVTIPMVRDFHKRLGERSRMLVVIVGNVTADEVRQKLKLLASFPAGSYTPVTIQPLTEPSEPHVLVIDRPQSPTTYVYSAFVGPRAGKPDYWPMSVGLSHLRNILFEEIRTKRNLSYAPASFLTSTLGNGVGMMSVSSVYPDSSIVLMNAEMEKMRKGDFSAEDLEDSKQVYITSYYMRQMTNSGKASSLYYSERNAGSWKNAFSYDAIQEVDKDAVQKAFETYAHTMQVGIVGPSSKVTESKYMFRE